MYTHSRHLLSTATAVISLVALPVVARAQASLQPINITEPALKADKLDREAEEYELTDMSKWRVAARLRQEAASLRAADDPKGPLSLYWAARDQYYTGDERGGRVLMVQSAERALSIGDVVHAATAYTEAAYIASELRDMRGAREYATKARLLALSPMLTDAQREQIRKNLAIESFSTGLIASLERR
ncbi:MAG: hypothetical protein ACJ8AD_00570 [Gemmatimonadaceae bacterium]